MRTGGGFGGNGGGIGGMGPSKGTAGLLIGFIVAVVLGVSTAIPVIQDSIDAANVSGNTETVLLLLPLFIALLLLLALAQPLLERVS